MSQNIPINGQLTFVGSVAGQCSVQAQPQGGALTLMLPNVAPIANQVLSATVVNGFQVTLGWADVAQEGVDVTNFNQLSGTLATAQIAVVQGNGTKVQLSTGTTTSGNVATYDANGNTVSSGTNLTALATLASPNLAAPMKITGLLVFANNAAAITGGLAVGNLYRTGADPDLVAVVH